MYKIPGKHDRSTIHKAIRSQQSPIMNASGALPLGYIQNRAVEVVNFNGKYYKL